MNVVLFGASGMVGAPDLRHTDFFDYSTIESRLTGRDACFFCVGVSSAGMGEAKYRRLTSISRSPRRTRCSRPIRR
jgi:hypothetical protein